MEVKAFKIDLKHSTATGSVVPDNLPIPADNCFHKYCSVTSMENSPEHNLYCEHVVTSGQVMLSVFGIQRLCANQHVLACRLTYSNLTGIVANEVNQSEKSWLP